MTASYTGIPDNRSGMNGYFEMENLETLQATSLQRGGVYVIQSRIQTIKTAY